MTQSQIAVQCRVTQQAYEKLENGDVHRPRYLVELADALRVSAKWLLTGEEIFSPYNPAPAGSSKKVAVFRYTASPDSMPVQWDAPIDWTASLPPLENTGAACPAAIYVQGDGLEPVYRHGYTVFINRCKFPPKDADCVYEDKKGIRLGRFLRQDADYCYFVTLCRKGEVKVPLHDLKGVYMIVGALYG